MSDFLLILHSWLRWVLLALFVIVIYRSYTGKNSGKNYTSDDKRWNTFLIACMHSQLLIGLILYFSSPMMKGIMASFGESMKNAESRFWSVEHITGMIIAIVIAQVGSIRIKKELVDSNKFNIGIKYYSIALLVILLMIPFGFWNAARPFFRM